MTPLPFYSNLQRSNDLIESPHPHVNRLSTIHEHLESAEAGSGTVSRDSNVNESKRNSIAQSGATISSAFAGSERNSYAEPVTPSRDRPGTISEWLRRQRKYCSLFSGCIMMACSWGLIMSYGIFFEHYDHKLAPSIPDSQLSLVGGTQSFMALFLSVWVGRLLDRRRHYYVLAAGFGLMVVGLFSLSFINQLKLDTQKFGIMWLTQGFLTSVGMSCFFMYGLHNTIAWFPSKPHLATGMASSGAGIGGLIFPPMIDKLLLKYDFSNGVRIFTGIIAGLLLVACCLGLLIPAPNPQQPQESQSEQEGAKLETLPRPSKWIRMVRKNTPYMLYIASIGCIFAGYYPIVFHLGEWVEEKRHWAGGPSYSLIIIMNSCNFVGRVVTGFVAHKWDYPILIQASTSMAAMILVMISWPRASSRADVIVFSVMLGLLAGAMFGLPSSGVSHLIPEEHKASRGLWTGIMWASCAIPAFLGPVIGGRLIDRYGLNVLGYWAGGNFALAGILLLGSFFLTKKWPGGWTGIIFI